MNPRTAQRLCALVCAHSNLPVHFVQYADDWFKNERYVAHTVESVEIMNVLVDYNTEKDCMELVAYGDTDIQNRINEYVASGVVNVKDVNEYKIQNTQRWIVCILLEATL